MTIHGSKGLQAPVVVVSGLFAAGKADASMSVQDNILVTPQVLAGRIQPWRPKTVLRTACGLSRRDEQGARQSRASSEILRALTRVKDRLIITGSPGNRSTFDEESGTLSVRFAPDPRTMGRMFIEGLRRARGALVAMPLGYQRLNLRHLPYRSFPPISTKRAQPECVVERIAAWRARLERFEVVSPSVVL